MLWVGGLDTQEAVQAIDTLKLAYGAAAHLMETVTTSWADSTSWATITALRETVISG